MTDVEAQIEQDWPSDSPVALACLEIWSQLSGSHKLIDHYSYGDLQALTKVDDMTSLTRAVMYLATPLLGVLKPALMYEFEGQILELPEDELSHFALGESVIHPHFGEPISDAQLFLAFEPGERLLRDGKP